MPITVIASYDGRGNGQDVDAGAYCSLLAMIVALHGTICLSMIVDLDMAILGRIPCIRDMKRVPWGIGCTIILAR